ncbi:inositol monophosphatase, partial [Acinetobacter variabilis]
ELIIKEAGGVVVDARGGNDSLENGQVIACSLKMLKPLMQTVVPAWGQAAK